MVFKNPKLARPTSALLFIKTSSQDNDRSSPLNKSVPVKWKWKSLFTRSTF